MNCIPVLIRLQKNDIKIFRYTFYIYMQMRWNKTVVEFSAPDLDLMLAIQQNCTPNPILNQNFSRTMPDPTSEI